MWSFFWTKFKGVGNPDETYSHFKQDINLMENEEIKSPKSRLIKAMLQPLPNGSGPKIEPDRPSVYTGPFWNRSGMDPKFDLLFHRSSFGSIWIRFRSVSEWSCVNRSLSGPV